MILQSQGSRGELFLYFRFIAPISLFLSMCYLSGYEKDREIDKKTKIGKFLWWQRRIGLVFGLNCGHDFRHGKCLTSKQSIDIW